MNMVVTRWRPILVTIVETLPAEEAVDSILMLLKQILPDFTPAVAQQSHPQRPARAARAAHTPQVKNKPGRPPGRPAGPTRTTQVLNTNGGRAGPRATKTPLDPSRPMLDDTAYYTVDEACAYLGMVSSNMYNVMKERPDRYPHQREKLENGQTRLKLLGRGLNKDRIERDKREKQRQERQESNPDYSPPADEGADPDASPEDNDEFQLPDDTHGNVRAGDFR